MKRRWIKGSYTIEAAVYIPLLLFVMCKTLQLAIGFWQESREREISKYLQELDIVQEFYSYQIVDEIGKEFTDD